MIQSSPFDADFRFAERCLAGEGAAVAELNELISTWVRSYLVHRGARGDESGVIAGTLIGDCVTAPDGKRPLLASYLGQCPLRAWLSRVALNRLISFKRTQQRELSRFGTRPGDQVLAELPDDRSGSTEEPVLQVLHEAIVHAFGQCEPESLVMLQLLHADGLRPEEIARMFDCVSTTVTRNAERARASIQGAIMARVHERDPWLEVTFEDLIAICRTALPDCLGWK